MNKSQRMQFQAVAVLLGIFFLFLLIIAGIVIGVGKRREQPEGEYIKKQNADILLTAAEMTGIGSGMDPEEPFVTFAQARESFGVFTELREQIARLEEVYEDRHRILSKDWYALYEEVLKIKGLTERITRVELVPLGFGEQVKNAAGETLPESMLVTKDSAFSFLSEDFKEYRFMTVIAYQKDQTLLTVYKGTGADCAMHNVWVMEADPAYFMFFWNDYEIRIDYGEDFAAQAGQIIPEGVREQIADITFQDGRIASVTAKMDKINGKILSLSEENITLEGIGTLSFSEDLKIYQIYDMLAKKYTGDLRIGYDFSDFVISDGKVEACLITRDEAMENIRVLIHNTDYNGKYHEKVSVTADTDFVIRYGTYEAPGQQSFKAGESVEIDAGSEYFTGDRVVVEPAALTGKISLLSVGRSQGIPSYRGQIEIRKMPEGLVVINEVLLEEYLYCVVPSEMPSSYPLEALKAQAVCARTYAYRRMMKSGLPSFGAHVDDSTSFQVYNNIKENVETTKAVRETKGQLLYVGEDLAEAYYYSTSCGFGTTADVWKNAAPQLIYLQAKRIGRIGADEACNGNTLTDEAVFRSYFTNLHERDYESTEGWYRWTYTVDQLDCEILGGRMQKRQQAVKNQILKQGSDGTFSDTGIDSFKKVLGITCNKRGEGGVLDEVLIETDSGMYLITGEYNIRYVLNNGEAKVCRQDGSEVNSPSLLPSSFLVIDTIEGEQGITGYTLTGGGFGHGVGMSQNGARHMAKDGMDALQILAFFYDGSHVAAVY